jgi:hypothetical protein
MNETTLDSMATPASNVAKAKPKTKRNRVGAYGYLTLAAMVCGGWLLRNEGLVDPEEGLGYWLGIIGGSMMLLLLFYPAGKKSSLLRRMGLVKHWFRIHMIFGLVGPALILYHCNFSVDALNSKVALYSMLAVTTSGIIGRYFYTRIHRGLYGKRANVEELRAELSDALGNSRGLAAILPGFINELHLVSANLTGDEHTKSIGLGHSLSWTFSYYIVRLRLYFKINSELREGAAINDVVRRNARNIRKTANAYAAKQAALMRQVAQLAFYERLFSLWHVFHMPLFLLLVASALVHVLAVHMY